MIETISRRDRGADETRDRLNRLMNETRPEQEQQRTELLADQQWVDVSAEPPEPPPREPWWRRGRAGRLMADWTPEASTGGRRRSTVALVGGLVLAVLVAIGVSISSGGVEHEAPPLLPVAAATQSVSAESSIVVSVVGLVARPGLVTLPEGARVADALREVGGPVPGADLNALNLARRLADGEQIYVGVPAPAGGEPVSGAPGSASSDKVDLNMATLAELDTLPGVGPVTAQRILDWRTEHGQFDSVEQLREIDGIGPSRFAKLRDMVVAR
ncbi:ComEA family DNA-binding protein [Actinophytocola sp.]|uniref:ComEA family DNA-binding protein n=1 Tax=Actinophytocola sp. TaxID=1872138 RepID=UPI002ED59843